MPPYLEEAAFPLWLWTDGLTDLELSPSSSISISFCRSSKDAMIPNAIKLIMTPKQGYHIASDETLTYHTLTPLDGCSPGLLKNGIKIKCACFLTWKIKIKLDVWLQQLKLSLYQRILFLCLYFLTSVLDYTYQTQRIPWQMQCLHRHSSCLLL